MQTSQGHGQTFDIQLADRSEASRATGTGDTIEDANLGSSRASLTDRLRRKLNRMSPWIRYPVMALPVLTAVTCAGLAGGAIGHNFAEGECTTKIKELGDSDYLRGLAAGQADRSTVTVYLPSPTLTSGLGDTFNTESGSLPEMYVTQTLAGDPTETSRPKRRRSKRADSAAGVDA